MSRRHARECALQLLYQIDLTDAEFDQRLKDTFWAGSKEDNNVKEFAESIVRGTSENIAWLDKVIRKAAEHWQLERMAVIDKTILRIAAYELIFRPEIPPSVTINEAIEIAKKYSTEESASFINGILDRISKMPGKEKNENHSIINDQ